MSSYRNFIKCAVILSTTMIFALCYGATDRFVWIRTISHFKIPEPFCPHTKQICFFAGILKNISRYIWHCFCTANLTRRISLFHRHFAANILCALSPNFINYFFDKFLLQFYDKKYIIIYHKYN